MINKTHKTKIRYTDPLYPYTFIYHINLCEITPAKTFNSQRAGQYVFSSRHLSFLSHCILYRKLQIAVTEKERSYGRESVYLLIQSNKIYEIRKLAQPAK